jgi:metal-responsive CopG/Arc/MetJ family transcriptional regulator
VDVRVRITLDDELVAQLDARVGRGRRSAFISQAVRRALEDERRWQDLESGFGALVGVEHEWDADPAGWVRVQRGYSTPGAAGA